MGEALATPHRRTIHTKARQDSDERREKSPSTWERAKGVEEKDLGQFHMGMNLLKLYCD